MGRRNRTLSAVIACLALLLALGAAQALADGFEITEAEAQLTNPDGSPATQASAHPYETTTTFQTSVVAQPGDEPEEPSNRIVIPEENVKDITAVLPAGLIGNPQATPRCENADLIGLVPQCAPETQLGVATLALTIGNLQTARLPIYNLVPPPGSPAEFGFNLDGIPIYMRPSLRTGGDYGIDVDFHDISQALSLSRSVIAFWGVPGDPAHDTERGFADGRACATVSAAERDSGVVCENGFSAAVRPFLTSPSACSATPLATALRINTWQHPELDFGRGFDLTGATPADPVAIGGCAAALAHFKPSLTVKPTTTAAASESGLEVDLTLPQTDDTVASPADADQLYAASGSKVAIATPALRSAKVVLPGGMTINPAAASGLGACSEAEVDLKGAGPARCPESSKLGTAEIVTPLFDHPLGGAIFLARQGQNKFGALLAAYIAIDDPATGTVVKLPGRLQADDASGQLTASFAENPQLPFSEFRLRFFGGKGAALLTPETCGNYTASAAFSSWSAADPEHPSAAETVGSSDTFTIDRGPGGAPCPTGTFNPSLRAGTANPTAGAFSPLLLRLSREEGTERFATVTAALPAGLLASLKSIPYCPEAALAAIPSAEGTGAAQLKAPACPAASQVGRVSTGLGAGAPLFVNGGRAYLAGPYKGAPLSLAVVVPALAGPFDLGNVAVRVALQVDPTSARVTAVSDSIPAFVHGIPLDIRSLAVDLDRDQFTVNPTSCEPASIDASFTSVTKKTASAGNRFQVGGCGSLRFKPSIALSLIGPTHRAAHPALHAVVRYPSGGGYANVARAAVQLPHSEFLENAHLRNICTRVQFSGPGCPKGSIYGYARVLSPLLESPLSGPVYLRASGRQLPDLVADLRGQIRVQLVGRIDSAHKGIRTTFSGVPDAPISRFDLSLLGGKKGLLVNSTDVCVGKHRARVGFEAQNGRSTAVKPALKAACKK